MLDDLLKAERSFRQLAEKRARALTAVLTELAYRLAGERLEQMRQADPSAPTGWSPEDWQNFFLAVSLTPSEGWGNGNGHSNGKEAEIAALRAKIATLERELALARMRPRATKPEHPEHTEQQQPPTPVDSGRLAGFVMPTIPKAFEHRWQLRAPMSKADAELHLRRRAMVLKCLADGINAQIEIGRYVGDATGAQYRSGSIRRVFDALEESGLIIRQTLEMQVAANLPTRLAVARLSAEGKQFCKAIGWEIVESDWERLVRLHEGEKQEAHTLAILLFSAAARLQGWAVEILPEVQGNARPDMAVSQGDLRLYVEVESGTRLHDDNAKWRMNAELNGGRVALVARNVEERGVLVADCKNVAEHGYASDIESLIANKFVEDSTPVWVENW